MSDTTHSPGAVGIVPFRADLAAAAGEVAGRAVLAAFAPCYPPAVVARLLRAVTPAALADAAARGTVVVALAAGRVAGTGGLDGPWVHSVYVAPEAWGRGIGRAVVAALEAAARAAGHPAARLFAGPPAEGFYRKLGYRPAGGLDVDGAWVVEMHKPLPAGGVVTTGEGSHGPGNDQEGLEAEGQRGRV